jgi:hypothetical protein
LCVPEGRFVRSGLTAAEFHRLADVPPEVEWFANISNPNRPELTKRPEFDSYGTDREQAAHISPTERVLAVLPSFLAPSSLTENELRVCAALAAAEAPLDERGSLRGDRALWRFHLGRLVPRRIVVPRPSRPERHDRSITVDEGSFRMVGVVIQVKVMAVNCIGHNGPP